MRDRDAAQSDMVTRLEGMDVVAVAGANIRKPSPITGKSLIGHRNIPCPGQFHIVRLKNVRQLFGSIVEFQPGQPPVRGEQRPNLLQELGLSPEQIQSVRRINQQRKPLEQAARKRFQDAQRSLNMAIYGDSVDDADVQSKLAEFQAAQADLANLNCSDRKFPMASNTRADALSLPML